MKSKTPKNRNPVAKFLKTQGLRRKVEQSKKVYSRKKKLDKGDIDTPGS